jgi:hypothetical protein
MKRLTSSLVNCLLAHMLCLLASTSPLSILDSFFHIAQRSKGISTSSPLAFELSLTLSSSHFSKMEYHFSLPLDGKHLHSCYPRAFSTHWSRRAVKAELTTTLEGSQRMTSPACHSQRGQLLLCGSIWPAETAALFMTSRNPRQRTQLSLPKFL